ncbi:MAG: hypothetical protein NZ849_02540 [Meiothermus sp.]|nr:hypothetical protein [Meiothermus sp.]MCS7058602.1 hypothetical protein [Meiothermus sp.]MCS7193783.1 hypothetical protein [Meiothermus sp.]MCX7739666.1 hypothetical protein [Meiothermus sp.]MDW8091625.1 hypothetical protein [Meiothermus sp.]MDW8481941.1 hypothetical protein [Meiothermus sp.]
MDNPLWNPANPFVVWTYTAVYVAVFGYLGYLLWRYQRKRGQG